MEAIQIIVNGLPLDVPENAQASITYEGNNIGNLSDRNGDFGKTFNLPMTGNNRTAFGLSDLVESDADPNTLLPCQVFVNNWQVFNGTIKVARYFGNQIQVELVGGLGKVIDQVKDLDLGDFEYPEFGTYEVNQADYTSLMTTSADLVKVGKVDIGAWTGSQNVDADFLPQYYPVQLPLWYELRATIRQIAQGLGYVLAGDILTDSRVDGLYLQQGYWGNHRPQDAFAGKKAVVPFTAAAVFAISPTNATNFNYFTLASSSDIPWINTISGSLFEIKADYRAVAGHYKVKISWGFSGRISGPTTYNQTYKAVVFVGGAFSATDVATYSEIAETEIVLTSAYQLEASFVVEFDYNLTAYGGGDLFLNIFQESGGTTTVGLYELQAEITYEPVDYQIPNTIRRPQDVLPRINVGDFFLDVCQRFGYYVSADQTTNEIRFDKLDKLLLRERAIDWNSKIYTEEKAMFVGQYETTFSFGDYAAKNWYEDANGGNRGYLAANVTNKDSESTAYTSIGSEVTVKQVVKDRRVLPTTQTQSFGCEPSDNFSMWDVIPAGNVTFINGLEVEARIAGSPGNSTIPPLYRPSTDNPNSSFINISLQHFSWQNNTVVYGRLAAAIGDLVVWGNVGPSSATIVSNPCLFEPFFGGWQSILNERYGWLQSILSNPRVHKVLVRIRPTDIPFDYTRPIYWNCAYWYLISVQDWNPINGDTAVALLAYLPDYPNG